MGMVGVTFLDHYRNRTAQLVIDVLNYQECAAEVACLLCRQCVIKGYRTWRARVTWRNPRHRAPGCRHRCRPLCRGYSRPIELIHTAFAHSDKGAFLASPCW